MTANNTFPALSVMFDNRFNWEAVKNGSRARKLTPESFIRTNNTMGNLRLSNFSLAPKVYAESPELGRGTADGQVLAARTGGCSPIRIAAARGLEAAADFTRDTLPQAPNDVILQNLRGSRLYMHDKLSPQKNDDGTGGGGESNNKAMEDLDFQKWFASSKVRDEAGNPKRVYHGSTHVIDSFNSAVYGNPAHHMGASYYFTDNTDDVNDNYAGIGPDLERRIDLETFQLYRKMSNTPLDYIPEVAKAFVISPDIARKRLEDAAAAWKQAGVFDVMRYIILHEDPLYLIAHKIKEQELAPTGGVVYPVYLRIENPLYFSVTHGTVLDQAGLDRFRSAALSVGKKYGLDASLLTTPLDRIRPPISMYKLMQSLRKFEEWKKIKNPADGRDIFGQIVSEIYQKMGYDGAIVDAWEVFGPGDDIFAQIGQRLFGNLSSVGIKGATHYVVWNADQIRFAIQSGINNKFQTTPPLDPTQAKGGTGGGGGAAAVVQSMNPDQIRGSGGQAARIAPILFPFLYPASDVIDTIQQMIALGAATASTISTAVMASPAWPALVATQSFLTTYDAQIATALTGAFFLSDVGQLTGDVVHNFLWRTVQYVLLYPETTPANLAAIGSTVTLGDTMTITVRGGKIEVPIVRERTRQGRELRYFPDTTNDVREQMIASGTIGPDIRLVPVTRDHLSPDSPIRNFAFRAATSRSAIFVGSYFLAGAISDALFGERINSLVIAPIAFTSHAVIGNVVQSVIVKPIRIGIILIDTVRWYMLGKKDTLSSPSPRIVHAAEAVHEKIAGIPAWIGSFFNRMNIRVFMPWRVVGYIALQPIQR